jgi:N-hydroxyarylamine O-acetyltransferase
LNVDAYLDRIHYAGPLAPTADTLRALHTAHLYAVPFENLDIGLGRPLSLALPALFDKIVTRRRGGFCYELNGLFGWLLLSLGYDVTHLSARVAQPGSDGGLGPEFDHLTLRVLCPAGAADDSGPWLADVGFGDSFVEPLRLAHGLRQSQGQRTFWLEQNGERWVYWMQSPGGAAEPQNEFSLQARAFPADYEPMCRYQQSSPESHFTQHRLCTLATPTGRLTLSDQRFIVTENGQKRERAIDAAEFDRRLKTDFGVDLDRAA